MTMASADTERLLICALLKGGRVTTAIDIGDFSYYSSEYAVIEELTKKRKTVDFASVSAKLTDITALSDCIRSDGRAALADNYADVIHSLAKRRKVLEAIRKAEAELESNPLAETTDVVDSLRDSFISLTDAQSDWTPIKDVMTATTDQLIRQRKDKNPSISIATGCESVDRIIGGFYKGEMTVIGARPAVGKSAFALQIAYNAGLNHKRVGIISREMSDTQLGMRLLSKASGINGMTLRKGEWDEAEWEDAKDAAGILSELDINFLFSVRNVEDLRRQVQARSEIAPLDILIVDYLQLMGTSKVTQSEHLRVGEISRILKEITVDYNIPVIALAQVNRDTDGALPSLKNLKDSGSIEQDADSVIFLHRPLSAADSSVHPQDKGSFENWQRNGLDYIVVNVAKQRQGETGMTALLFDKAHMRYLNIDR